MEYKNIMSERDLKTDKNTSMMYRLFVNEDKVRTDELDEINRVVKNSIPKLEKDIEPIRDPPTLSSKRGGDKHLDLPPKIVPISKDDTESSTESSDSSSSSSSSTSEKKHSDKKNEYEYREEPIPEKKKETPEERAKRQLEYFQKLENLKNKFKIKLTRFYTIDSDPDIMQQEYEMHMSNRKKERGVNFYKSILCGCAGLIEQTNDTYNPFEFSLAGWSDQIKAENEDYVEILEELYEKYQNVGKNAPPEVRLLMYLTYSAVMFGFAKNLGEKMGIPADINKINQIRSALKTANTGVNPNNSEMMKMLEHKEESKTVQSKEMQDQIMKLKIEQDRLENERRQFDLQRQNMLSIQKQLQDENTRIIKEKENIIEISKQLETKQTELNNMFIKLQSNNNNQNNLTNQNNNILTNQINKPLNKIPNLTQPQHIKPYNQLDLNKLFESETKPITKETKNSSSEDELLQEIANSLTDKDLSHLINSSDKKSSDITSNTRKKKKTLNL